MAEELRFQDGLAFNLSLNKGARIMIIGKISGSFPHHGFTALGTVHLDAGDAALMGGLGPADLTEAEIRCPRSLAGT